MEGLKYYHPLNFKPMKLQITLLLTAIYFGSSVTAQDGLSGDGSCDPCNLTCEIYSKREIGFKVPRMIEANETNMSWEEGEYARWIKPADGITAFEPQILTLSFNCATVPEICYNNCYGFFCKKLPTQLTVNRTVCAANRKANLCGSTNPNYCSAKKSVFLIPSNEVLICHRGFTAGFSCDEYPYASTIQGGAGAATRCVPKVQNSMQGGAISGFYTNGQGTGKIADGTAYKVALTGATALGGYCVNYPAAPPAANCGALYGNATAAPSQK